MLRLPLPPAPGLASAYAAPSSIPDDGTEDDRVWCLGGGGDDEDSFESGALRRREISTVTVWNRRCRQG